MNDTAFFFPQDLVTIRPQFRGKLPATAVYRVIDVPGGRRTSYLIEDVASSGRVKVPGAAYLEAHSGPVPAAAELLPPLTLGATVFAEAGHKIPAEPPYVVLGTKPNGDVKIVRLGGDGNRFWTAPRRCLREVTPAEALAALAAL
ncbi:hypothetical protein [Pseudonocardia sp. T1-2H]|uniref:hypothetical protein n=1 Tax=Pseudonocardia sp. T1-2H TaxID=3128899 RepID=UPI003100B51B